MNVSVQASASIRTGTGIFDMDIHPAYNSMQELYEFMPQRWVDFHKEYGTIAHQYFKGHPIYPRIYMRGSRQDAVPVPGEAAGSSLPFMQEQHLDHYGIAHGMLFPLPLEVGLHNAEFSAAVCHAINCWQAAKFLDHDKRLLATIVIPMEDPAASVREIEHWAGDNRFAQVGIPSRSGRLLGSRYFWPVFEAAVKANRPVAVHPSWSDSDLPITSAGWPSFYFEEAAAYAWAMQAHLASFILSGYLDQNPDLKLVLIEGGFSWLPAFCWRLDKLWPKFRNEVPIKNEPSSYVRKHVWLTSQPIDEPDSVQQLKDTFDLIGWDKMLFSSDYPHWDNDDPKYVLPFEVTPEQRSAFFYGNAARLYGFD